MPEIPASLIDALCAAERIAVLTGAGVSAESGVPTFRDAQSGLWSKFNPQELATREAFQRNPRLVWEWYAHRREMMARVRPNPGHLALVELERRVPVFTLTTQNIDGLHALAGSRNLIELHGNIHRTKCFREDVPTAPLFADPEVPPRCPRCGSFLRPDVVWFGEMLPQGAYARALDSALTCDVYLSIGTSGVVEPAASLPFEALAHGAVVIEINPDETSLSESATYHIAAPSGVALPQILDLVLSR